MLKWKEAHCRLQLCVHSSLCEQLRSRCFALGAKQERTEYRYVKLKSMMAIVGGNLSTT